LGRIKEFSKTFEDFGQRLNSLIIELEDISNEVANAAEKIEADPEMLFQINEKLQMLYKLQQKHSVSTVSELLEIEAILEKKVTSTLGIDDKIEVLDKQQEKLRKDLLKISAELHNNREAASPVLKKKLEETLLPLRMPNARLQVEVSLSESFKNNGT